MTPLLEQVGVAMQAPTRKLAQHAQNNFIIDSHLVLSFVRIHRTEERMGTIRRAVAEQQVGEAEKRYSQGFTTMLYVWHRVL